VNPDLEVRFIGRIHNMAWYGFTSHDLRIRIHHGHQPASQYLLCKLSSCSVHTNVSNDSICL